MLNRLVGKDRIIWGTWDTGVPEDKLDIFFQLHDLASDDRHQVLNLIKSMRRKVKMSSNKRGLI